MERIQKPPSCPRISYSVFFCFCVSSLGDDDAGQRFGDSRAVHGALLAHHLLSSSKSWRNSGGLALMNGLFNFSNKCMCSQCRLT
jgi:hypothetical protein